MRGGLLPLEMCYTPRVLRASAFARFAWALLAYNLAVIAWGAYVRASGSGAGCGAHWPLCNGEAIPRAPRIQTLVEFSHRASSGVGLVLTLVLAAWAWRACDRPTRRAAYASAIFYAMEALIGAGLVLFQLVDRDASTMRALSIALHLVNTFFLLASLGMTALFASIPTLMPRVRGALAILLAAALAGVIAAATTGAIAALGDTLFPSASLAQGLAEDLSPRAHLFVRLRGLHPLLAPVSGALVLAAATFARVARPTAAVRRASHAAVGAFLMQAAAGLLNLALLAPIWMQLVHLLLADVVWLALVVLAATALSSPALAPSRMPRAAPVIDSM